MLFQSTLCQSLCCFSQLCVSLYVVSVNSVSGFMLFQSALCQSSCCFSQPCVSLYVVSVDSDCHLCCFSQLCVSFMLFQSTLTVSALCWFSQLCVRPYVVMIFMWFVLLFCKRGAGNLEPSHFVFCSEAATSRNRSEQRRWHCVRRICQGENHLC